MIYYRFHDKSFLGFFVFYFLEGEEVARAESRFKRVGNE